MAAGKMTHTENNKTNCGWLLFYTNKLFHITVTVSKMSVYDKITQKINTYQWIQHLSKFWSAMHTMVYLQNILLGGKFVTTQRQIINFIQYQWISSYMQTGKQANEQTPKAGYCFCCISICIDIRHVKDSAYIEQLWCKSEI